MLANEGSVVNTGDIDVAVHSDDVISYVQGLDLANSVSWFQNTGSITVSGTFDEVREDNDRVDVEELGGVYTDNAVEDSLNMGRIEVWSHIGDIRGERAWGKIDTLYGTYLDDSVSRFENRGYIGATGNIGDVTGDHGQAQIYPLYGVYANYGGGTFINAGTISATASIGDLLGQESTGRLETIAGVYLNYTVEGFENRGDVLVSATLGTVYNGIAKGEVGVAEVARVYGVAAFSEVRSFIGSFSNNGTISVSASIGDNRSASNDYIELHEVYGIYLASGVGRLDNSGRIQVVAGSGTGYGGDSYKNDVYVSDIYGVYAYEVGDFRNNGWIDVFAQVGDAQGYLTGARVEGIHGVCVDYGLNTLQNRGEIRGEAVAGNALGRDSLVMAHDVTGLKIGGSETGGRGHDIC